MASEIQPHSRGVHRVFPFLRGIAYLLFGFFACPIRVRDAKRVPAEGAVLVISNHLSNSDPVVVQYASPRLVHFLARRELFGMGLLGKFVSWWRAIPIKQSSADKGAIKSAVELLKSGQAVGIFPEGQLSFDGKLLELFEGTALIVRLSGATCVCVGLKNTNRFMPAPRVFPWWGFSRIEAQWGQPRTFTKSTEPEEIMSWIESELKTLSGQV